MGLYRGGLRGPDQIRLFRGGVLHGVHGRARVARSRSGVETRSGRNGLDVALFISKCVSVSASALPSVCSSVGGVFVCFGGVFVCWGRVRLFWGRVRLLLERVPTYTCLHKSGLVHMPHGQWVGVRSARALRPLRLAGSLQTHHHAPDGFLLCVSIKSVLCSPDPDLLSRELLSISVSLSRTHTSACTRFHTGLRDGVRSLVQSRKRSAFVDIPCRCRCRCRNEECGGGGTVEPY
jgi:hypothetical protein